MQIILEVSVMRRLTCFCFIFMIGCSSIAVPQVQWLTSSQTEISPKETNRVPPSKIHTLSEKEMDIAVQKLELHQYLSISAKQINELFPSISGKIDPLAGHYLVRAEADRSGGVYSGFYEGQTLLILYNRMGSCGPEVRSAVVIELKAAPVRIYGGCSGAL